MTEPSPLRRPRRSNADYRWTKAKILAFLQALAVNGPVAAAARAVGMSRQSAYRLRVRLGPAFGAVWDDGLALAHVMRCAAPPRPQGDSTRAKVTAARAR